MFFNLLTLPLVLLCVTVAHAQTPYPAKPIRVVVGFAPGGGSDLLARALGARLTEAWGQPVITDNRAGAGGAIAQEITARAAPDGYTVQIVSGSQLTNTSLFTKTSFDVTRAFAPITQLTSQPYVLMVHPALPAKSVKELIAYAKVKAGGLNYASSGTGSSAHLGMELFNYQAHLTMVHVPYKGIGVAMIDLISGQVQLLLASAIAAAPQMRSGKLRAMAVTSSKRFSLLPELPTVAESGLPGFEVAGWYGLAAPAGVPNPVIEKLNAEIGRILRTADMRDKLAADGTEAAPSSAQAFGVLIKSEIAKWRKLVLETGLKLHPG